MSEDQRGNQQRSGGPDPAALPCHFNIDSGQGEHQALPQHRGSSQTEEDVSHVRGCPLERHLDDFHGGRRQGNEQQQQGQWEGREFQRVDPIAAHETADPPEGDTRDGQAEAAVYGWEWPGRQDGYQRPKNCNAGAKPRVGGDTHEDPRPAKPSQDDTDERNQWQVRVAIIPPGEGQQGGQWFAAQWQDQQAQREEEEMPLREWLGDIPHRRR